MAEMINIPKESLKDVPKIHAKEILCNIILNMHGEHAVKEKVVYNYFSNEDGDGRVMEWVDTYLNPDTGKTIKVLYGEGYPIISLNDSSEHKVDCIVCIPSDRPVGLVRHILDSEEKEARNTSIEYEEMLISYPNFVLT